MVELSVQDHCDLLKKYLLHLPRRFNFDFNEAARVDLRRTLYYSASEGGNYLDSFFPDVDPDLLPKHLAQVLMSDKCEIQQPQDFYLNKKRTADPCHPHRACGRKFKKGEPIYRCITCGQDESSGLCLNCYNEEFHKDHDVILSICQREFGGVCDCGDIEAWKTDLHCKYFHTEETAQEEFPEGFKNAIFLTIGTVLDYVVDVMAGSSSSITKGHRDSASIVQESVRSNLRPDKYHGNDWNSEKFYLLLYNDQNKQYRDAIQRISLTTKKVNDFSTMVADEVNSNGRAKILGSGQIDELLEAQKVLEATGLSSCIRSARDIFREEMCVDMINWLNDITNGAIRGNYNITRDALLRAICSPWRCGVETSPLPDSHSVGFLDLENIPNVSMSARDSSVPKSEYWKFVPTKWNVDEDLAKSTGYDVNFSFNYQDKKSFHGSRFQYLLYFDIRYWKSFRVLLHDLFNTVLTSNLQYRSLLCCQYVDIYPSMLELFFLHDREPEFSCMTTLNQILTPFGNATMIADHGDLTRLLAAAYSFLTSLTVRRPCDVGTTLRLAPGAFKNRKVGQVFFDTCCILLKSKSTEKILSLQFIHQVCDILQLFQGKPTVKREALEHVEYESNDYGLYFNIYSVISSLSEMVAKSFLNAPNSKDSSDLTALAFSRLYGILISQQGEDDSNDIYDLVTRQVDTLEGTLNITDFKVHANQVSFLHPMHAFLTWMLQYSDITDVSQITGFQEVDADKSLTRLLIEYPLRVIVMLSQIKIGFWVRNGFSIRTQLHIYKSSGIRESGYRRDLFMLQFLASVSDSELVLMTIFDRWALLPWLKEDFGNHDDYDESTLPLVVEECILFFIHMLCETTYSSDPTEVIDKRLSVEIIHALCFGPLTYSKLCSEVPDFLVHEKRYDLVLKRVADYIPPINSTQTGIYKLKEEFFEEVDPFYIHYSSNKREEAEKVVKERVGKKLKIPAREAFITPNLKSLDGTIFKGLFRQTASRYFAQFLKSTLKYINNEGILKSDTLLNFTLHLIHIAVEGKNLTYAREFNQNIWSELTADHNEPFYYESVGSLLYKFLKDDDFALHHPKIRAIFRALKEKDRTLDSYLREQVQNFDASIMGADFLSPPPTASSDFERKKRLARERREKIMAKFKQQQCQFVEKNHIEDDASDPDADMEDDEELIGWQYPEEHCILCQMPKGPDEFFGVVFNALPSSTFRTVPFEDKYWTIRAFEDYNDSSETDNVKQYFHEIKEKNIVGPGFPSNQYDCTHTGVVASSCGHGMHYSCYQNYLSSARTRQTQITRTVPEDFENLEFICPLCKSLGNLFIPILWSCNRNSLKEFLNPSELWYQGFESLNYSSFADHEAANNFTESLVNEVKSSLKGAYKNMVFQNEIPSTLNEISLRITKRLSELAQPHFRQYLTKLIANTISSTEIAIRGSSKDQFVADQLSNQTLTTLRTLVEYKKTWFTILANNQQHKTKSNGYAVKVAAESLGKLSYLSSDKVFEVFDDLDFFEMLISCFPTRDVSNNSIQRLCYTGFVIQTIAVLLSQLREEMFDDPVGLFDLKLIDVSSETKYNMLNLIRQIRDNHPVFDNLSDDVFEDDRFPSLVFTLLTRSITPFLRKVLIWSFACCANADDVERKFEYENDLEATKLSKFLNFPTLDELLSLFNDSETYENSKFSGFVHYIQTTDNDLRFSKLEYPGIVRLIDVPTRLDDVFTKILYKGPEVQSLSNYDPAICLFCGKVVNLQKGSCGESKGECNNHYENECLNDFGIFLLPKHSSILLLHKGNGSFHPAPYIDSHGEHDSDARQGQIMTLSEDKYETFIRQMWLQHDVPNYVTRKLEGTLDIGGWETL